SEQQVDELFKEAISNKGFNLTVDLEAGYIKGAQIGDINFSVDNFRRHCLLNGLDDIGLTLEQSDFIKQYEAKRKAQAPWLFAE
ncbi:MAG TPA: 3-isopropylmalate dehydratase small subunit, partial [Oceanospirillaceae bacterium]|nr:3-isopropylmalate dehydratase small subunit [Oceanospirillaceae bacterium]